MPEAQQHTQKRNLSSAWTFSAKFVFPAVWITVFGLGTILLWIGGFHDRNNALPSPQLKFALPVMWVLGSTFMFWASTGLKRVHVDERQLHISNYVREICVPFTAVTDVKQNRWINYRPITIYFRDTTEFGDRATFMPKRRFDFRFWRNDPVVSELKQLAELTG
jgi:hypothetical protein